MYCFELVYFCSRDSGESSVSLKLLDIPEHARSCFMHIGIRLIVFPFVLQRPEESIHDLAALKVGRKLTSDDLVDLFTIRGIHAFIRSHTEP